MVAYFIFLRRNCLVGGLCNSILSLLDLWLPVDGNVVDIYIINCFLWAGGYSSFKRGSAEFSIEISVYKHITWIVQLIVVKL